MNWRQWCGFDLETARPIFDGWQENPGELGITCAATYKNTNQILHLPQFLPGELFSEEDAASLHVHLSIAQALGYRVVTWNGLSFDFRVLHALVPSRYKRSVKRLALEHIDVGFQMVCERGFMIGLNKAAESLGVGEKTKGVSGLIVPALWLGIPDELDDQETLDQIKALDVFPGSIGAQKLCLEYVTNDARITGEVYARLVQDPSLSWVSQKGKPNTWKPQTKEDRLLTVSECLELPHPGWGWDREEFYGWTS